MLLTAYVTDRGNDSMTNPLNNPSEQEQNRVTGMLPLDPYAVEPAEPAPPIKLEPLFNKKVMIAWAALAFGAWFVMSVVVPAAFQSVKIAIREAVRETETTGPNGTTKVIILPNGKRITIRTDAPPAAGTPAPLPVPPQQPTAAEPAAPVVAPVPAAKK
jgi:hypothetical protein